MNKAMENNAWFKRALGGMVNEVAYAAAVRHLTDEGLSVKEIRKTLTYPAPYEAVKKIAYEQLLKSGVLMEYEINDGDENETSDYVVEEGQYGRKSYRRVKTKSTLKKDEYIPCDFGLLSDVELLKIKDILTEKEWDYIDGIPWKKKRVYHKATPQMTRIMEKIGRTKDYGC